MIAASVTVETAKLLFGMCNHMIPSDFGIGQFFACTGDLHVCGLACISRHRM